MVRPSLRCRRNLVTDGAAEFWILLVNVSLVRVSKAHGNLMNRGRPVRFERLLSGSPSVARLANPGCSGLPPPMAPARLPIPGSDLVADLRSGLIEPLGVCVAQTSRNLRQAARYRFIKSRQKRLSGFR